VKEAPLPEDQETESGQQASI